MGKVIKVIDLLNMIANGEEVPEKIKWDKEEYEYEEIIKDYLDYEVEIPDEKDEIDIQSIEEIEPIGYSTRDDKRDAILNDLVTAVKQLDNKLKEK